MSVSDPGEMDGAQRQPVRMIRPAPGASATLSNVGPERLPPLDDEELHIYEGTSSGMRLRGKPHAGSREGQLR